jgi:hypothetical protein
MRPGPRYPCQHWCVGNRFTAHGSSAERDELYLSNGGTDVLFDVLTLAGCDLAKTAWEQNLVLYFADGHRLGMGTAGFDLSDIPWTANWRAEKAFFLRMIDMAASHRGWDRLRYDPPYAADWLAIYHAMVAGFVPAPAAVPDLPIWRTAPREELLARCGRHDICQGELGCRLCDPSIQPST